MKSTILYYNKGNPYYLKYSIAQTVEYCPDARVILLGDEANASLELTEHYKISDYFGAAEDFAKTYVHFSTNNREFDLACFQTWFVFAEFVRRENIVGPVVCMDHDVLIYQNISEVFDGTFDLATTSIVGNQYTFFSEARFLIDFAGFIQKQFISAAGLSQLKSIYDTKESPVPLPGGWICDMTLLGLYALGFRDRGRYRDLSIEHSGAVFDYALHQSEGYDYNAYKRIKKISWKGRVPYGRREGRRVRFAAIHFQVGTKVFLPHYYRGHRRFSDMFYHRIIEIRGYVTSGIKWVLGRRN